MSPQIYFEVDTGVPIVSEWEGLQVFLSNLTHLRFIFSTCWKLQYYQAICDLIKAFSVKFCPYYFVTSLHFSRVDIFQH